MITYEYTTAQAAVDAAYRMEADIADDLGMSVDELEGGVFYDCVRSIEFSVDPKVKADFLRQCGLGKLD
jgi:hypothetical protein